MAGLVRAVVIVGPLAASVCAGIAASRLFRPVGWPAVAVWVVWTAGVSLAVLALTDAAARRLLPLQRLLQLCLVFPDRAPSRLRIAARAAARRRPERWAEATEVPPDAAEAATRIVELLAALATHDRRTRGHSERVCAYAELLAEEMELPSSDRDRLTWVALIHDIGKLEVPRRLLNKPGRPTVTEWQMLQSHPVQGDRMAAPLRGWLGPWADAVLQHHERYDGRGYPRGLRGDQTCLGARIIAVTDAFEVMTAPRAYRRPVDAQSARSELARQAGTQFDPDVVRHFLAIGLPRLHASMGALSWIAQIPFVRAWPRLQSASTVTAGQAAAATAVASYAGLLAFGTAGELPAAAAHAADGGHASLGGEIVQPAPRPVHVQPPHHDAAASAHASSGHATARSKPGSTSVPSAAGLSPAPVATGTNDVAACAATARGHHRGWSHEVGSSAATDALRAHRDPQRHRTGC